MQEGLYRSEFEHDSCGIGAVVDLSNIPTHETISDALYMLSNMEHRGGRGSDPKSGDGAGISIQVPHQFLKDVTGRDFENGGIEIKDVVSMSQNKRVKNVKVGLPF